MDKRLILIFLFHYDFVYTSHIKIYNFNRCNKNTYYPVTISDVHVEVKNRDVYVSGSLTTDVDINSPVKASLDVDRYVDYIKIWVPVPCIDGIGSCTYNNLCIWGKPQNETCPDHFVRDNVPCRCPIFEGTYIMEPDNKIYLFKAPEKTRIISGMLRFSTPVTGTYSVHAEVTSGKELLSCYEFYIDYDDTYHISDNMESNEIWPRIDLIR